MADDQVGEYINKHFVSTFFKVGTFTVVDGNTKQGGNVASYFCLSDGSVLHAIAGPVDADTLLREARWAVDARKMAWLETRGDPQELARFMQNAHAERLSADHHFSPWKRRPRAAYYVITPRHKRNRNDWTKLTSASMAKPEPPAREFYYPPNMWYRFNNQGKIHAILGKNPLMKIEGVYKKVFEEILNQKVTTLPVVER